MIGNIDQFIDGLLADFNTKRRKVIEGRFGLKSERRATLQKIGDGLGITRERVRQIEEQCMSKIGDRIRKQAPDFLKCARVYLVRGGGVRRDDVFVSDLRYILGVDAKTKHPDHKIRFLLLVAGTPALYKESDAMHGFWYADENSRKGFLKFVDKITKLLKTGDRKDVLRQNAYLAECKNCVSYHFLSIPKHFGMNVFGEFGLKEWPEIEPKTIRDKAYLVLKRHGKPFHFEDIAKYINRYGIDKKSAHIQTVHNELIKDDRFVLVGRGMYALQEHGFEPGTVREVITGILKKRGPLVSNDVIGLVNQQRILKENTILLSLQNRRHFKRLDDGRYHVKGLV